MMFAIIQTGGKQYKVSSGQKIKIEKLAPEKRASAQGLRQSESAHPNGGRVVFDKVLLIADGENVKIGAPYVEDAKVEAKILRQGRDRKKIVFRYHSKTRHRKKKGHRQHFTEMEIVKVV
jgi:large subunit ribosomal protein L21